MNLRNRRCRNVPSTGLRPASTSHAGFLVTLLGVVVVVVIGLVVRVTPRTDRESAARQTTAAVPAVPVTVVEDTATATAADVGGDGTALPTEVPDPVSTPIATESTVAERVPPASSTVPVRGPRDAAPPATDAPTTEPSTSVDPPSVPATDPPVVCQPDLAVTGTEMMGDEDSSVQYRVSAENHSDCPIEQATVTIDVNRNSTIPPVLSAGSWTPTAPVTTALVWTVGALAPGATQHADVYIHTPNSGQEATSFTRNGRIEGSVVGQADRDPSNNVVTAGCPSVIELRAHADTPVTTLDPTVTIDVQVRNVGTCTDRSVAIVGGGSDPAVLFPLVVPADGQWYSYSLQMSLSIYTPGTWRSSIIEHHGDLYDPLSGWLQQSVDFTFTMT